jgi:hypothetical protein
VYLALVLTNISWSARAKIESSSASSALDSWPSFARDQLVKMQLKGGSQQAIGYSRGDGNEDARDRRVGRVIGVSLGPRKDDGLAFTAIAVQQV